MTLCAKFALIGLVVREKIFKFRQSISAILSLPPLGNGRGPSFVQTWVPTTQEGLVRSWAEIDPVVQEKKKMWKVYRLTDRKTTGDQKSSFKLLAQVS